MKELVMTTHAADQSRRRLLGAAATLGIAPWLMSACAQIASAP